MHDVAKTNRFVFDDAATIHKNHALMESLGNPQEKYPAIHVAGTSGKGTICYMIESILRAHKKRTGMTTSPHVYDIRERVQLNGRLIGEDAFIDALNTVFSAAELHDIKVSYFEALTAMEYVTFSKVPLDYVVVETGFGGRLDATNVITRPDKICVLGQIGFDHTEVLGNTLEAIATEKAGIIQKDNTVVALKQDPAVNAVFEKRCKEQNAVIIWIEQSDTYQKTNQALAEKACKILADRDGWLLDKNLATTTCKQLFIPGRFERRDYKNRTVILDGAHNPQKLSALTTRTKLEGDSQVSLILAIGEHKNLIECLKSLAPIAKRVFATEYFTKQQDIPVRSVEAPVILEACKKLGIDAISTVSPEEALEKALVFPEPIVATGSFYLLSEIANVVENV